MSAPTSPPSIGKSKSQLAEGLAAFQAYKAGLNSSKKDETKDNLINQLNVTSKEETVHLKLVVVHKFRVPNQPKTFFKFLAKDVSGKTITAIMFEDKSGLFEKLEDGEDGSCVLITRGKVQKANERYNMSSSGLEIYVKNIEMIDKFVSADTPFNPVPLKYILDSISSDELIDCMGFISTEDPIVDTESMFSITISDADLKVTVTAFNESERNVLAATAGIALSKKHKFGFKRVKGNVYQTHKKKVVFQDGSDVFQFDNDLNIKLTDDFQFEKDDDRKVTENDGDRKVTEDQKGSTKKGNKRLRDF